MCLSIFVYRNLNTYYGSFKDIQILLDSFKSSVIKHTMMKVKPFIRYVKRPKINVFVYFYYVKICKIQTVMKHSLRLYSVNFAL